MNKRRFLCLLLALVLSLSCLGVLSSCNPPVDSQSNEGSSGESTVPPTTIWHADLDFDEELVISQSINVYEGAASLPNAEKYTRGPDDIGADSVLNLCYTRNKEVAQALGLDISYVETNYYYNGINPYIDQLAVMAKAPADLIINDVYAVSSAMLKGQLYNLKSTVETNYLDFSQEGWYQDYINGLTYDESRIYAMAGDYFIDVVRTAHCLYINTEIFEIQLSDYYDSMKEFYQMIEDGDWDYDEFQTLITAGWKSTSGTTDAVLTDEYIGWLTQVAALMGTGFGQDISMVEKNGNTYVMKENTEDLSLFAKTVCDLFNADGVVIDDGLGLGVGGRRQYFTEGSVLFLSGFWLGDLEYPSFYAMEKKSAVIYPKWNESKKYGTWVHDSAEIGYILTNTATFTPTSAYCQLLNEKSVDIMREYFEYQLKYKQNTDPEALAMLDLIRDTIASPFEYYLTPSGCGIGFLVRNAVIPNNPASVATQYSSNRPDFEKKLGDKIAQFNNLVD